jgi:DNA polymerase III epsilon subunit-like protein
LLWDSFDDGMNSLNSWLNTLSPSHFVCHANRKIFGKFSSYDYGVLLSNLNYLGLHFNLYKVCPSRDIISTHSLAKFTELSCSLDLKSLCSYYNINLSNHHDAKSDTIACMELLKKMLPDIDIEDFLSWELMEVQSESENLRDVTEPKRRKAKSKKSSNRFI